MNRMERKKTERADRIRQVALNCFQIKGFKNTTMAMIAESADISVGSLYNYYKNKNDLLLQPILESHAEHNKTIEDIVAQNIPLEQRWIGIIDMYILSFNRYGKRVWREFFSTVLSEKPELMAMITMIDQPFVLGMITLLEHSKTENPTATAGILYRLWLQIIMQWLLSEDESYNSIREVFMGDLRMLKVV